jgi:hypothetical protein
MSGVNVDDRWHSPLHTAIPQKTGNFGRKFNLLKQQGPSRLACERWATL